MSQSQIIVGGVVALESARLELVHEDRALPDRPCAEAALAGENRVLEMIAGGDSLPSILEALCLAVEGTWCGSLCSILLLDVKGERLCQGAAPSLPKIYLEAFIGREIASSWGPCGAAAFHKEQVVAADIEAAPHWDGCRDIVLSHGLRACWSTPIFSPDGRVLGTLAVLSREPCSPAPEDQGTIKQFTHLASIAIERKRSEEALRRSEAYLTEAQKLSHTGSFGWKVATGKLVWSAETFRILGYEPTLKPTLEMVLKRVHPADVKGVREMIDRAPRERNGFDLEHRLLMPNGTIKHLHVVARPSRTDSGDVELVGAVMDITERKLRDITERKRAQAAVMAERNRMARDIHDTLAQGFTGVIVQLEAVAEAMSQGLVAKADEFLARAGALARESLQEARRSVRALRPRSLEEHDLCEALRILIRKMTDGTSIQAEFRCGANRGNSRRIGKRICCASGRKS